MARRRMLLAINKSVVPLGGCTCISFHAMMHYVDTGEAVVTSNKM